MNKETNCLTFQILKQGGQTRLLRCPYDLSCNGTNCAMLKQEKKELKEDRDQEKEIQSWIINSQRRN